MPNNITNILEFKGEIRRIEELLNTIKSIDDEGETHEIDFEKIIPMPKNVFKGDLGEKERIIYGKDNWYDWSRVNWGTKWNAYYIELVNNIIKFDTAWAAPHQVVRKLSEMFSDILIIHKWADENTGYNCGHIEYLNGEIEYDGCVDNASTEAYKLYIECKGESDCLYKDENGNWAKHNCNECDGCD